MAGAPAPETVTVAVDANGADLGPAEVAAGAARAAESGVHVLLFGPEGEIGDVAPGVEVIPAPVSIAKAPDPVRAARSTPEASIVLAARAVAEGRAQALVAGGSTGTALAAGLFHVKRAPGIYRPALALPLPIPRNPVTLLDVGANTEVRPEHLVQFAFMGAAFVRAVLGIERPRVGLLSNGTEVARGSELVLAAHATLAERTADSDALEFVGNVEGDGVTAGAADVVVSDGFMGNVALKLIEGVSQTILDAVREAALSSPRSKLGGALLRPALRGFRAEIDPEEQGGAYLLGLRRLGVVPHGRFTRLGIGRAIERAALGVRQDVVGRTHQALAAAGALRTPPAAQAGAAPAEAATARGVVPPSGSATSVSPA
ncbi:MAG: phosphate acyltransferase PlsX [Actinobacteria bacterium]|nr:MAG: phosphate acyltransferase PlsX [Actinomycetota bacterium]